MTAFQLVREDGTVAADGYTVFGRYVVAWRGEPQQYRTWASVEEAIAAHGDTGLTVRSA